RVERGTAPPPRHGLSDGGDGLMAETGSQLALPASTFGGLMVSPINRDTTRARYITPTNISRLAMARACTVIGMTSPMPVLDSSAKLRNISSVQVRGACGSTAAEKQPGCKVWHST